MKQRKILKNDEGVKTMYNQLARIKEQTAGITLIALVITIIILLILAGISLNLILGQNGIVSKAGEAKDKGTQDQGNTEIALNTLYDEMIGSINGDGSDDPTKGIQLVETLELELVEGETVTGNLTATLRGIEGEISWSNSDDEVATISGTTGATITVTAVAKGETTITAACGSYTATCKVIVTKTEPLTLKVGDFVNYTAGNWTEDDISKLGSLYAGEDLPTSSTEYKFGGFKVGDSKDANVKAYNTTYSGWRVLKVEDGKVTIVHAGVPEGFYIPYNSKSSFKGEYILNRNTTNSMITDDIKGEVTETRDWSMYEDGNLAETGSACCLEEADIFKISKDDSLRKVGIKYYLPSQYEAMEQWLLIQVDHNGNVVGNKGECAGVRPVVSLKSNVKIIGGDGTSEDTAYILSVEN